MISCLLLFFLFLLSPCPVSFSISTGNLGSPGVKTVKSRLSSVPRYGQTPGGRGSWKSAPPRPHAGCPATCPCLYTSTCSYIFTHYRIGAHARTHTQHRCTCTHTCVFTCTHTHTYMCTDTHVHTCALAHIHAHVHTKVASGLSFFLLYGQSTKSPDPSSKASADHPMKPLQPLPHASFSAAT